MDAQPSNASGGILVVITGHLEVRLGQPQGVKMCVLTIIGRQGQTDELYTDIPTHTRGLDVLCL